METRIAVAGATGRVGRHVVDALEAAGYPTVAMSRATGVDVFTGEGLDEALGGVYAIVDAATEFVEAAAHNLQRAGARAGVERIVAVSIIGTGGAAKAAHERATLAGPVPARILRAAPFHELVAQLIDRGRQGEVSVVPAMRTRLVAASAVADRLARLAVIWSWEAVPMITEVAGPREERLAEMARLLVAHRGEDLRIEEGDDLDADGSLLPGPGATLTGPSFAQWLGSALPVAA